MDGSECEPFASFLCIVSADTSEALSWFNRINRFHHCISSLIGTAQSHVSI